MSLLDHFEDPGARSVVGAPTNTMAAVSAASASMAGMDISGHQPQPYFDSDPPKCVLDRVQFSFPDELIAVAVSSNMLVVALKTYLTPKETTRLRVLRIDLDKPDAVEDIIFNSKQKEDVLERVFYSPAANHLIISCQSGDNYYLPAKWTKPRLLSKIRGVRIRSVAWRPTDTADTTGPILLGSTRGHVYETELVPKEDYFKKEERYFSQVFTFRQDAPVIGLVVMPCGQEHRDGYRDGGDGGGSVMRYAVVMASPTRLVQMVGDVRPVHDVNYYAALFTQNEGAVEFLEMPGNVGESEMRVVRSMVPDGSNSSNGGGGHVVMRLGWLTGAGLYLGDVTVAGKSQGDTVVDAPQVLPYAVSTDVTGRSTDPGALVSFVLTDVHFILLFETAIVAISTLSHTVVTHEPFNLSTNEIAKGMAYDSANKTYWAYTNTTLYEVIVTDEDRDVWSMYLEKRSYEQAAVYAKTEEQRCMVYERQAEELFTRNQVMQAAELFAKTRIPFEEVCLRLMATKNEAALTTFLRKKLAGFKKNELTQVTLVGTWLLELMASKVCESGQRVSALSRHVEPQSEQETRLRAARHENDAVTTDLRVLLREYKDRLHHPTVYAILASHGCTNELVYFAELTNDREKLISFYMDQRDWHKALDVISRQDSVDFYYKHSAALIQYIPREVVSLWMKVPSLNPRFLMPSMLNLHRLDTHQFGDDDAAISTAPHASLVHYLEHLVATGNRDRVVHNYLLLMYACESTRDDESPVLSLIHAQRDAPVFNVPYALRVCGERGLMQSCVQLYTLMGLYDEAVHLALEQGDLDLACIIADKPEDSPTTGAMYTAGVGGVGGIGVGGVGNGFNDTSVSGDMRKKLWLRIAQHVITHAKDVKTALVTLKSSHLNIEDILPLFPDFVKIDDFKDELCGALEAYTTAIQSLQTELEDATRASESIRHELRELKHRYVIVTAMETCQVCGSALLTKQFVAFACHHAFHADCLVQAIVRDSVRGKKVMMLREELDKGHGVGHVVVRGNDAVPVVATAAAVTNSVLSSASRQRLKDELDDLISQECILCGDAMIKSVDAPFVSHDEVF